MELTECEKHRPHRPSPLYTAYIACIGALPVRNFSISLAGASHDSRRMSLNLVRFRSLSRPARSRAPPRAPVRYVYLTFH